MLEPALLVVAPAQLGVLTIHPHCSSSKKPYFIHYPACCTRGSPQLAESMHILLQLSKLLLRALHSTQARVCTSSVLGLALVAKTVQGAEACSQGPTPNTPGSIAASCSPLQSSISRSATGLYSAQALKHSSAVASRLFSPHTSASPQKLQPASQPQLCLPSRVLPAVLIRTAVSLGQIRHDICIYSSQGSTPVQAGWVPHQLTSSPATVSVLATHSVLRITRACFPLGVLNTVSGASCSLACEVAPAPLASLLTAALAAGFASASGAPCTKSCVLP